MTTFAALGDSITLGIGDPVGGRSWRGWAALLADGLTDPELHILAASGACAAEIERDQLPRALSLRPDIASVIFGINDTLRPGFDPELIASSTERTVAALRSTGAQVLTMRLPDAGRMLGLPGVLARPLARRTQQINAVLDAVSSRFGTIHFDAAGTPETYDRRMWAVDRLHPNERGHRLIARSFHSLLATAGHPVGPPLTRSRPIRRHPGSRRSPGWRQRERRGWSAGPPTWCRISWRWLLPRCWGQPAGGLALPASLASRPRKREISCSLMPPRRCSSKSMAAARSVMNI